MDKLYLITGAAGHLGSTLVQKLVKEKKNVRALVLFGEKNIPQGNVDLYYGDVCNKKSLLAFFDNPENKDLIVIHCAGIVSISSKYEQKVFDVNVLGTKNIVDLSIKYNVKRFIYVSSVHAIAEKLPGETIVEVKEFNPDKVVGLYAKTKAEATDYVLSSVSRGLNAIIVHPSGISGPFDSGRGHFTALIIDYCKGRLTSGVSGGYDFVDVRDVGDGILASIDKGRVGETYILSNDYFSIKEILEELSKITKKKPVKRFLPLWFVKLVAHPAEYYYRILKRPPLFTAYSIYTLNTNARFSHKKASLELGYKTRPLNKTLEDTISWLKKNNRL